MAVPSAGKLHVLVVVQEQDASDHTLYTDCTNGQIWINLQPLMGRERYEAQAIHPTVTHRVTLRYWPGLTGQHRLKRKDTGKLLELLSDPLEIQRQAWFQVDVSERDDPDA